MSLTIRIRKTDDGVMLGLAGSLTLEDVALLRETIRVQVNEGARNFVLDFGELSSIDSAGLGALISIFSTIRNKGVSVKSVGMSAKARGLLQMTKLTTVFGASTGEVSRFFGIIIRMFSEIGAKHQSPHFHAYHQEEIGVFSIEPVELIEGTLPLRQRRLVEEWAERHQQELMADWIAVQQGKAPPPIEPLK